MLNNLEETVFGYVDRVKAVVSMELWDDIFLNCGKNEVLILVLLYRQKEVNMSQIAEYINVPLNTATGIVSRMEKRKWLERQRSLADKRVVTIRLTEEGKMHMNRMIQEFVSYASKIMEGLTREELDLLNGVFNTVISVISSEKIHETVKSGARMVRKIFIE
jgi:DNA-binding MarR family transcriptional regulator